LRAVAAVAAAPTVAAVAAPRDELDLAGPLEVDLLVVTLGSAPARDLTVEARDMIASGIAFEDDRDGAPRLTLAGGACGRAVSAILTASESVAPRSAVGAPRAGAAADVERRERSARFHGARGLSCELVGGLSIDHPPKLHLHA
jgi:hypothetical protein